MTVICGRVHCVSGAVGGRRPVSDHVAPSHEMRLLLGALLGAAAQGLRQLCLPSAQGDSGPEEMKHAL